MTNADQCIAHLVKRTISMAGATSQTNYGTIPIMRSQSTLHLSIPSTKQIFRLLQKIYSRQSLS